jgi:hypothetical protein
LRAKHGKEGTILTIISFIGNLAVFAAIAFVLDASYMQGALGPQQSSPFISTLSFDLYKFDKFGEFRRKN